MNDICQSCGMKMQENDRGKNADGSTNDDYCKYCFPNGAFGKDETMEEMIESCIPFMLEGGECKTQKEARDLLYTIMPTLKRWK